MMEIITHRESNVNSPKRAIFAVTTYDILTAAKRSRYRLLAAMLAGATIGSVVSLNAVSYKTDINIKALASGLTLSEPTIVNQNLASALADSSKNKVFVRSFIDRLEKEAQGTSEWARSAAGALDYLSRKLGNENSNLDSQETRPQLEGLMTAFLSGQLANGVRTGEEQLAPHSLNYYFYYSGNSVWNFTFSADQPGISGPILVATSYALSKFIEVVNAEKQKQLTATHQVHLEVATEAFTEIKTRYLNEKKRYESDLYAVRAGLSSINNRLLTIEKKAGIAPSPDIYRSSAGIKYSDLSLAMDNKGSLRITEIQNKLIIDELMRRLDNLLMHRYINEATSREIADRLASLIARSSILVSELGAITDSYTRLLREYEEKVIASKTTVPSETYALPEAEYDPLLVESDRQLGNIDRNTSFLVLGSGLGLVVSLALGFLILLANLFTQSQRCRSGNESKGSI